MRRTKLNTKENGQALLLIIAALGVCLLAGMGLTIDLSQMYSHQQLAQTAADSAALAAMMSIFNATNTTNATFNNTFGKITVAGQNPSRLTCASNDNHTPCYYARQNGFDPSNGDTVYVDFWTQANAFTQEPGVSISNAAKDTVPLLRVTVMRTVPATVMRLVGGAGKKIAAQATAAITTSVSPIPILVLHPTDSGALSESGNPNITICGGPRRSIQVNSCAGTGGSIAKPDGSGSASCHSGTSISVGGSSSIDLSHAGPLDTGACATGTGSDLGNFGFPRTSPGGINYGSVGAYLDPVSVIADPLLSIAAPTTTGLTNQDSTDCLESAGQSICNDGQTPTAHPVTCPSNDAFGNSVSSCDVFKPGIYTSAGPLTNIKKDFVIFTPGVYYIQSGGVTFASNSAAQTQTAPPIGAPTAYPTCTNPDAKTGCGILLYFSAAGGTLNVDANAGKKNGISLLGSDPTLTYQRMVIFVDHGAPAQSHSFGGGGQWNVTGTVYMTNTITTTLNSTGQAQFQSLTLQGNSGSGTVTGEIIVDELAMGGTPAITMNLDPAPLQVRYIALVR
jgi:hypothetical protein